MGALNEARVWAAADPHPAHYTPSDQVAYESASNLPSVAVELDVDVEAFQDSINRAIWNLRALGISAERAGDDLTATFPDPEDMPSTAPEPPRQVNVIVTATVALLVVAGLLGWLLS